MNLHPAVALHYEILLIMLWVDLSLSLSLKWTLLQLWESAKTTIAGLHVSHLGDPPEGNMWFQVALPPFASELCTSFNWALSCSTVGIIKLCGCCGNWGNTDVVCQVVMWPFCVGFSTVLLVVLSKPCWRSVFSHLFWVLILSHSVFFSLTNVNLH